MSDNIWNEIADKYEHLWVQKYSLAPTRKKVTEIVNKIETKDNFKLLDIGCGTGQLIEALIKIHPNAEYIGIDKSSAMIHLANNKKLNCTFLEQDASNIDFNANTFDIITCCHSFPYYQDKTSVIKNIQKILKFDGTAIFIQASVNNIYDEIVMAVVEKTAEKADYLSIGAFKKLFEKDFKLIEDFKIKEKFFMPTIAGFIMRKKDENITGQS